MSRSRNALRLAMATLTAAVVGATLPSSASAAPISEVRCSGDGSRVALLIGNQDYIGSMQPLANPRRDTDTFAKLLCTHSFTVFRYSDLDTAAFDAAIANFVAVSKAAK